MSILYYELAGKLLHLSSARWYEASLLFFLELNLLEEAMLTPGEWLENAKYRIYFFLLSYSNFLSYFPFFLFYYVHVYI
eukprot:gene11860-8148_t